MLGLEALTVCMSHREPAATMSTDSKTQPAVSMLVVLGLYLTGLGAVRTIEVFPLVGRFEVEGYPAWLLYYLAAISLLLFGAGVLSLSAAIAARARSQFALLLGLGASFALLVFVLGHSMFLVRVENSFGDGGLVPGIIHIMMLTRKTTTGTPAGVIGYKLGLGVGMFMWLGIAGLVAVWSMGLRKK